MTANWFSSPGWILDGTDQIPEAARAVPGIEALHGIARPRPRTRRAPDPYADRTSALVDSKTWEEWGVAGHPDLVFIGYDGSCGCPVYKHRRAENPRSIILHDCLQHGCGMHAFSGTVIAEFGRAHASRLDFAAWLHGRQNDLTSFAAEHGISLHESPTGYTLAEIKQMAGRPAPALQVIAGGAQGGAATAPTLSSVPAIGAVSGEVLIEGTGVVSPVPFTLASDPGPFPIDALPTVIRAHAEWVMDAVNVPASMVAPMYLPVLAAACGRAVIIPRPGWVELGPIWVIVISPPSSRKSPVLALVKAPIEAVQAILAAQVEDERTAALAEVEALEEMLTDAKKRYGKARMDEVSGRVHPAEGVDAANAGVEPPAIGTVRSSTRDLLDQLKHLQAQLRAAKEAVPVRAQLIYDDATDAAMQDLMKETGGYAFQIAPEAGGWFTKMVTGDGFYSPDGYLKGYSGEPYSVFRVGRGEISIPNPYLCLLHIIQPEPLAAALKPDANGRCLLFGNGVWARYGATHVESVEADVFDRPIPDGGPEAVAYSALIQREFLRSYGRVDPLQFTLTEEATAIFAAIYDRIERIKESQQQLGAAGMAEEWGKTAGKVLRTARVFTQVELSDGELADPNRDLKVGADALARAWRVEEWFMASQAHAMRGPTAVSDDDLIAAAIAWIRKTLRAKGPTAYRKLHDSQRHRRWLNAALDRMWADGEVTFPDGPRSPTTITPLNLAAAS